MYRLNIANYLLLCGENVVAMFSLLRVFDWIFFALSRSNDIHKIKSTGGSSLSDFAD